MDEREALRRLILLSTPGQALLTDRELEVLRLMPNHSGQEISRELGIKYTTIRNLKHSIYAKLGIAGGRGPEKRLKAVLKAIDLGIINLSKVKFRRVRKSGEVWI